MDGLTGELKWKTVLGQGGHAKRGAGALSFDQKTYYVQWLKPGATPASGELVALNTADGSKKWSYPNGIYADGDVDVDPLYSVVVDKVGKVYFKTYDNGTQTTLITCVQDNGQGNVSLVWSKGSEPSAEQWAQAESCSFHTDRTKYFVAKNARTTPPKAHTRLRMRLPTSRS